jgi:hypothetical protein
LEETDLDADKKDDDRDESDSHDELTHDDKPSQPSNKPLPESFFLYRNALLYGSDHNQKKPFNQTDLSIEFVCHHLRLHGFSFLLDVELDSY